MFHKPKHAKAHVHGKLYENKQTFIEHTSDKIKNDAVGTFWEPKEMLNC